MFSLVDGDPLAWLCTHSLLMQGLTEIDIGPVSTEGVFYKESMSIKQHDARFVCKNGGKSKSPVHQYPGKVW